MLGVDTGKLETLLERLEAVADKQLEAAEIIARSTEEFGGHVDRLEAAGAKPIPTHIRQGY